MDRRDFIKKALCAGCLYRMYLSKNEYDLGYAKDFNEEVTNNFDRYFKDKPFIRNVDIHLVEHCNLSCKYCFHFSNIAEEEFLEPKDFEKDMKQFSTVTEGRVLYISLLGGEPLLNPKINEFMRISRKYFPMSNIKVLTNGILLNSMTDSFWESLHKYSITLLQSLYPINIPNKEKYLEKAKKYNIKINGKINFIDNITDFDKDKITEFQKLNLHLNGDVNIKNRFFNCEQKGYCYQLYHGKFYPCSVIQGIQHFNKKFGKNLEVVEGDYINIYKAKNFEDFWKFMNNPYPFCKYCGEITEERKWESSPEHDISEWTNDIT